MLSTIVNAGQSSKPPAAAPAAAQAKSSQPSSALPAANQDGDAKSSRPAPTLSAVHQGADAKSSQPAPAVPGPRKPDNGKPPRAPKARRSDVEKLERLETEVAAYQVSWIRAGAALAMIHAGELYRQKAATFEQYLKERWQMKKRHGLKLITAAGVVRNVGKELAGWLPLCAALELAKLPAGQQADCLRQSLASAGGKRPSTADLATAVAKRLPPAKRKKAKAKATVIKLKCGVVRLKAGVDVKVLIEELTARLAVKPRAA